MNSCWKVFLVFELPTQTACFNEPPKEIWGIGDQRKNRYHPDHCSVKIS